MRLLELFSGTGSIGRAFAEQGWEVTSLDIDPKSGATLITDFMTWQYSELPKGHSWIFRALFFFDLLKKKRLFTKKTVVRFFF
jgi:hypothetical protein